MTIKRVLVAGMLVFFAAVAVAVLAGGADFAGADETVTGIANHYAQAVGAGEREPYINTDRGDLLLFLFALAGLVTGFYLGYHCREFFGKPAGSRLIGQGE